MTNNLIGQRFGRLIVLSRAENSKAGKAQWICQCDCGNTTKVITSHLKSGHTSSCGCLHLETLEKIQKTSKVVDLTGIKVNRLTVVSYAGNDKWGNSLWNCVCDCGNTTIVRNSEIRSKRTFSCGCYQKEQKREQFKKLATKHNMSRTRLYTIYKGMKQRCYNPNAKHYNRYGGRGIKICDEWLNNRQAFFEWALANGYRDDLSIDRIDNDKGYSPDNCRFATNQEQVDNRSCSKTFTYEGIEYKSLAEASRQLGISKTTLKYRAKKENGD